MTFYYLFGTEFSSGNQAPSCWLKYTSCVHKTYLLRYTLGKLSWSVMHGTARAVNLINQRLVNQ